MGILMIIFASLGLLGGLIGLAGSAAGPGLDEVKEWHTYMTMNKIVTVIGLGISALHLVAGLAAVRYKANAPMLARMYGLVNIIVTLGWSVVVFAWLKPAIEKAAGGLGAAAIGAGIVIGAIIGITWPILVLILMGRPAAKAACTN
jgi:hypothetical protein